jgi:carbamoyl-phosphate synthase large subunit
LKLSRALEEAGAPIIGTTPDSIDIAEDRERFQQLVRRLQLKQPANASARKEEQAILLAREVGYPLVVRPSYVLGGRAMEIVFNEDDLRSYMSRAVQVSNDAPVLLDRFLDVAIEVDVDAVCDGQDVLIGGIMEHIEQAGVHSGDSGCSLPPNSLSVALQDEMRSQTRKLARALNVVGLMNIQFAIQNGTVYLLEVNPRASRTVPFVSKATGVPIAKIAARVMTGRKLREMGVLEERVPRYYCVKEAVFPFLKFPEADPILGPEMKSTGEVMGTGRTFGEAYAKAQSASGVVLPRSGVAMISVRERDKAGAVPLARRLISYGFKLVATSGTAAVLKAAGIECSIANKVREGRPHIVDMIKNDEINLIVNTTEGKQAILESNSIRREAVHRRITYYTTLAAALATCEAYDHIDEVDVNRLQDLHKEVDTLSATGTVNVREIRREVGT